MSKEDKRSLVIRRRNGTAQPGSKAAVGEAAITPPAATSTGCAKASLSVVERAAIAVH
jgi:hypothetical protein